MRLFSFDHFSRPGDNRCKRGGLKDLELWSLLCITNSFRFILMQPNINVMWFRIGLFMLWSSLGHQDYFDFKVLLQSICNFHSLFNLKATCNVNLLKWKKQKNFEIPSPFGTWTLFGPFQTKVSLKNNFITENSTVE